ncbi:MAG: hypothetical protein AT710_00310 [Thermocladium sp. ECH_B]|nr:MAG: hypothetical protein AT710_00310 [Thermocladium sp. ECH_B]
MKPSLSAFDLMAIASELSVLTGRPIDKVYSANASLLIRVGGRDKSLIIASRNRVSITTRVPPNTEPSPLRQYIDGCRISGMLLPFFDRVLRMETDCGSLIIELLNPFNIALEREGIVKWVLHSYRSRDREIWPGKPYTPPPRLFRDPRFADSFIGVKRESLGRELGLGRDLALELCVRTDCGDPLMAWRELRSMIALAVLGPREPVIQVINGEPAFVSPIPFKSIGGELIRFNTFNEAVDEYFWRLEEREAASRAVESIKGEAAKLESSIREARESVARNLEAAQRYRRMGEAIMRNLYQLSEVINAARRLYAARDLSGLRELGSSNLTIKGFDPVKRLLSIIIDGESVELGLSESPGDAASRYFEAAKEAERKAKAAGETIKKLEEKLAQLNAEAETRETGFRDSVRIMYEKEWFERFKWFITLNNHGVLAGKNADQNEVIVKKYMRPRDLFFHADIPGAAATVLRASEVTPEEAIEVASFAASNSRLWSMGAMAGDVFYVEGSRVSKEAPAGEYIGRGSFMIYGERNWVHGVELGLGVGVRFDGNAARPVSAPPTAIKRLANIYVLISPGNVERGRAATMIRNKLVELDKRARTVLVEQLVELVPGPSRLIGEGRGEPMTWSEVKTIFNA